MAQDDAQEPALQELLKGHPEGFAVEAPSGDALASISFVARGRFARGIVSLVGLAGWAVMGSLLILYTSGYFTDVLVSRVVPPAAAATGSGSGSEMGALFMAGVFGVTLVLMAFGLVMLTLDTIHRFAGATVIEVLPSGLTFGRRVVSWEPVKLIPREGIREVVGRVNENRTDCFSAPAWDLVVCGSDEHTVLDFETKDNVAWLGGVLSAWSGAPFRMERPGEAAVKQDEDAAPRL